MLHFKYRRRNVFVFIQTFWRSE